MRQREDFKDGTLGANLLTTVATIDFGSDPGFATLAAGDYLVLVIDPEGAGNGPEVVYLTAFTATNTTGTISRGQEGTADPGVTHASGTVWRHGPTIEDFDRFVWALDSDDPSAAATVEFDISGFEAVHVMGWLRPATDNVVLQIRVSNDGGGSFRAGASDYRWGYLIHNFAGGENFYEDNADTGIAVYLNVGNGAGEGINVDLRFVAPGDVNRQTTVVGQSICHTNTGAITRLDGGGIVTTAEVNDAIQFLFSSGNIAAGRLAIYGYPAP